MSGNCYSLASLIKLHKFFHNNFQVIGIAIGSDPAQFFTNLLFHYESEWIGKVKTYFI